MCCGSRVVVVVVPDVGCASVVIVVGSMVDFVVLIDRCARRCIAVQNGIVCVGLHSRCKYVGGAVGDRAVSGGCGSGGGSWALSFGFSVVGVVGKWSAEVLLSRLTLLVVELCGLC